MHALIESSTRPNAAFQALDAVLANPDPQSLRDWSASGELAALLPEWSRLSGDWNIQHNAHHFPLNIHTFNVVEGTKASPYFGLLTPYQQFLTRWAALLHDIDKNTGPERLRDVISVDKLHPIKSAATSQEILQRLCCSPDTQQRIFTLIHHHQLIGRLFIIHPNGNVPEQLLTRMALKIRSAPLLRCLVALSEGDIRGVQHEHAYFTPQVSEQLAGYTVRLEAKLRHIRTSLPPLDLPGPDGDTPPHPALIIRPAADFADLAKTVTQLPWGGPVLADYHLDGTGIVSPYAIELRFLPENTAYIGPNVPELEAITTMPGFYAMLTTIETAEATLSEAEQAAVAHALRWRAQLLPHLEAFSRAEQFPGWTEASAWLENRTFSEPPVPQASQLTHGFSAMCRTLSDMPAAWSVLGTRPIITGVHLPQGDVDAWRARFPDIPMR